LDKKGCGGTIWTNLDVTSVIKRNDHIESCPVDEHLSYKMEKRAVLTKRSAEETKPIPAIYDEEASAEPSTPGCFPPFIWVKSAMYGHRAKRFPKLPNHRRDLQILVPFKTTKLLAAMRTWGMDGTFKIVPQWYQQLFTIHAFAAGKLVPAVYCLCTDKDIGTYGFKSQALISRAAALEVDLNPDTNICDFETALISTSARRYIGKPEAKEVMATSNHVLNVVVLPPTAGDSGSDDTDQEYLPDDPEDESDPAVQQFIGVIVLSRYNCQPEAKNYWSTQPDMGAQCAISCMARNRFMEIKKYLHLADNQKLVKGDKMSKVTPLYKLLNSSLVKHVCYVHYLSHNDGLSNDDLKQLAEPCIVNKTTVIDPKEDISLGSLTAEFLKSSIGNIAHIMDQFIDQNPDDKRSSKARWDVLDVTSCYPEILHERKRTERQLTILDGFIIKKCKEAKEVMATSNHVLNVVVLPPTAGDSGSDDTDQEYLPDDPEDESDPAGELEVKQEVRVEEFETAKLSRKRKESFASVEKHRRSGQDISEVWFQVFTDEMIDHITFQSNLYAHRECNNRAFTVSPQEIQQFIGVIVLSRYNCQPEAKNYWSTQPDMGAQCDISCMARNRFMEIKKYLHLADNQKLVKGDKMSKVTPLYKLLNSSLVKHGMFHEKLSVDESIVPYFGRHAAKMFLKGKPIRDVVKKETPKKDKTEASTGHGALASSSMDISDSLEGRRCEQVSTLQEAKEVMATSNHVLNVVVLPPTAGDSGSDDTDQEYLPDDPEDESDPAVQQFIGVIVLSRYNCQPEAKNYWSTQPDMGAQCAISCMARNRFMEIKKYLHLADNQKLVKGDKMSKVTPLYKLLNSSLVKHDTIICDFETALIPAIRGYFPNTRVQGCYFHFCQAVHRKVGELGLKTRYRTEEPTKRKIRMLLATAFLPVPHVNTGVSLLEAGTTGNLSALFQYFRQEWMTDERLPLWNVYNVNIRTNNHLEGWHNRLNRKAGKSHNGLYELLQLLISEQGVMDTLIQQVLSGNATVGDLRRVNKVYAQKQRQVARYTGEYTNGRRTLEQFLEALMYITPEPI
ncbi:PiggyBac transposable element-derived protein 3, partial [Trichinella sp. T9]